MKHDFLYHTELKSEPEEGRIVGLRLSNGMKIILLKDHSTPVVAVDIWYMVGSRNEQPGRSGFAHLFEHMMFEGSENVGKAQHMKLIYDVGGMVNGSTTQDRTNYFEVVPANQLELALWLEADRMRSLNLTDENFENQRSTVKEERRMRVDNQPYMRVLYELKDEIAYRNFAYQHSVIGSMADLDDAATEDVRNFHDIYYRPNNAVMAIAGDIDARHAFSLVRKYFEQIPAGPAVPAVDLTEPEQQAEKRKGYQDPFAPFPAYVASYHVPGRTHPDFYATELLEKLLFDGESSRLFHRLVEEEQMALHLVGGNDGKFGPALFFLFAQVRPDVTLAQVENVVEEEFERLVREKVTAKELEKVRNKVKAEFVSKQERVRNKADMLCAYTMLYNNPELLFTELDRYLSVTAGQLQEVAQKYFRKSNRSVIEVYPRNSAPAAEEMD